MSEKRMFSKVITESDAFLDLPLSTQALYFHLAMQADDDGFVSSPNKVRRMTGATQNEYDLLIAKRFVLQFDDGIIVIKHFLMHNYIRKDRYNPSTYLKEKAMLFIKENKAYTLDSNQGLPIGIPMVDVNKSSIDKSKENKSSIDKSKENKINKDIPIHKLKKHTEVYEYYKENCTSLPQPISLTEKRKESINARVREYGYEEVLKILDIAENSSFLKRDNEKKWLNFDWVFNPNNFVKISEGNYTEQKIIKVIYPEIIDEEIIELL